MHITLDTYPNAGGCIVHLADHEIEEILDEYSPWGDSATVDELKRQLESYLKSKEESA